MAYKTIKDFILQGKHTLLIIYLLAVIIVSLQQYYGEKKIFNDNSPIYYTQYNNYMIFKQSFFHLKNATNLYVAYPNEYFDLYKYSPTFALGFGLFSILPDELGLFMWNLVNALALFIGIQQLSLSVRQKKLLLAFCFFEMLTSLQNTQSNVLVAGLIVLSFSLMENKRFFLATLCIAVTVYIKLFSVVAFALCLLYPNRWRMVAYSFLTVTVLALLPLTIVSLDQLYISYHDWWQLLQQDYVPNSLTLVGIIRAFMGVTIPQNFVLRAGFFLFFIPFLKTDLYTSYAFRLRVLAVLLVWMIVFNHKAESPTFSIAITGIGIWYLSSQITKKWKLGLAVFALVFTSLSTTDIFPNFIQENYFDTYSVKAIAPLIIYFVMLYEFIFKPVAKKKLAVRTYS